VAGALNNYTARLVDSSLPASQINEALKFLVHFAGDIHQPLHVGFTTDEGGNTIDGVFEGEADNLHYIWDTPLVRLRITDIGNQDAYVGYLLKQIQTVWSNNATSWAACPSGLNVCPDPWAEESIVLACTHAYLDSLGNKIASGFNLGDSYYDFNQNVIDMQLAKGGVRLASILNRLFPASDVEEPKSLPLLDDILASN